MDCGIPFCHNGCPLGNLIPEWNDLVYRDGLGGRGRAAARHQQLPRVHRPAVPGAVRGGLRARHQRRPGDDQAGRGRRSSTGPGTTAGSSRVPPEPLTGHTRRGRRLRARPGSPPRSSSPGPGTQVTVFERADRIGGLLRYGIPEFKMEKRHLDRRLDADGGGGDAVPHQRQRRRQRPRSRAARGFDAVVLAGGATVARDLPVPGRELAGIHQAMEYLPLANRVQQGDLDGRRSARRASTS